MANQDSFISEVTDEVRRDKLFAIMRRYGWIAIALVVLIVGGAALNEWRKAQVQFKAEALGDGLVAALSVESVSERTFALAALPPGENAGQRALVAVMLAASEFDTGDVNAARATLDAVAANTEVPEIYRDLALLKSVIASSDDDPANRIARLEQISHAGNPFRLLAVEQRAFAEVELGKTATAIETLQGLLSDAETTEDLRSRAAQLIVALGGTPEQG